MAIKMIAYIGVAPVVGAYANRLPRRSFLVAMDLLRAGVALSLPFVTEVWQIYVLIGTLQAASAAFFSKTLHASFSRSVVPMRVKRPR